MTCSFIKVDGNWVHINHKGPRMLPCVECQTFSTRLCDWKVGESGKTCDAPLCDDHTTQPARGKDLCPTHAATWAADPANPKNIQPSFEFE